MAGGVWGVLAVACEPERNWAAGYGGLNLAIKICAISCV